MIQVYQFHIRKMYGPRHSRSCKQHPICRAQMAVRMLLTRLVEDGASSVQGYGTWRFRDLRSKMKSLGGKTIYFAYKEAVNECENHKLDAAVQILAREVFKKVIVYVESVEARSNSQQGFKGSMALRGLHAWWGRVTCRWTSSLGATPLQGEGSDLGVHERR